MTDTATTIDEWSASSDRAAELMMTGILLGSVHVLTPDHLSALSALSVGGSWRSFSLGVRWSLGHSIGLLLCFAAFVAFKGDLDLHALGQICDPIVGAFMLVIGVYGVVGSLREHRYKVLKKNASLTLSGAPDLDDLDDNVADREDREMLLLEAGGGNRSNSSGSSGSSGRDRTRDEDSLSSSRDDGEERYGHISKGLGLGLDDGEGSDLLAANRGAPSKGTHASAPAPTPTPAIKPFLDMKNPVHQKVISIAMGLLHGVAGPGGILGVLPAVEMQHWQSSLLYLGSFMVASTLSMGLFAGESPVCVLSEAGV